MGAFWSGTDNANENMTQFYGVYGKITSTEPEFLFRFVSGEHKINYSFWSLFEKPRAVTRTETIIEIPGQEPASSVQEQELDYKGPWPMVQYPEDWMEQHTKSWAVSRYQRGPTYASQGRGATPSGAYQSWAGLSGAYDDWEEGYYGGATHGHSGASHQGGAKRSSFADGSADAERNVKKNLNNASETSKQRSKKDEEVSDVIETDSSYIELLTKEIIEECDAEDIKKILQELCDYGYDYVITDLVKEQGDYRYGHM